MEQGEGDKTRTNNLAPYLKGFPAYIASPAFSYLTSDAQKKLPDYCDLIKQNSWLLPVVSTAFALCIMFAHHNHVLKRRRDSDIDAHAKLAHHGTSPLHPAPTPEAASPPADIPEPVEGNSSLDYLAAVSTSIFLMIALNSLSKDSSSDPNISHFVDGYITPIPMGAYAAILWVSSDATKKPAFCTSRARTG